MDSTRSVTAGDGILYAESWLPEYSTRAERALVLFEERGSFIRSVAADTFEVPSCGMRGKRYTVRYGGGVESCTCKDFEFNGGPCKHLIATALLFAALRPAPAPGVYGYRTGARRRSPAPLAPLGAVLSEVGYARAPRLEGNYPLGSRDVR